MVWTGRGRLGAGDWGGAPEWLRVRPNYPGWARLLAAMEHPAGGDRVGLLLEARMVMREGERERE